MIYPEQKEKFREELFINPTSHYRGAPFWAWNTKLDSEEISWQTDIFKKMGFGGYFMHVRTGLEDEYFGEKFNNAIRACAEKSKEENMLAWLYDEDRWPSGFAGGIVTKNKAYRQRFLFFTMNEKKDEPCFDEKGRLLSGSKLLARYDIHHFFGKLRSYRRLDENEIATGHTWYAYLCIAKEDSWFNDQTYVDTLNKEAIECFAEVTYGNYKKNIPMFLGNVSPAIFTDEPQIYSGNASLGCCLGRNYERPWTDDFADTYKKQYGEDILEVLPELFFELKEGYSPVRYRFWDHVSERFATAFSDTLGKKAKEIGVELTGHLMREPDLNDSTRAVGDVMRGYRGFGVPGIDMLCSNYEFTTAKQCQSVVHQYGKEGMLSELYGVSRWDYEFRNYKIHGDWQATLGVTLRVPHLSMMSMKGEAKRDYPASIFYQSPWYEKYKIIEDHFGRVNTALTGGKPLTDIAVIHPVESIWQEIGIRERTEYKRYKRCTDFKKITEWLLRDGFDFDFISEALLPDLCPEADYPLTVGKMQYKVIVVPDCATLRESTVIRLERFVQRGGKVIFVGKVPTKMDAVPTHRPEELCKKCQVIPFEEESIVSSLEPYRTVGIYDKRTGKHTDDVLYCLRARDEGMWLFLSRAYHKQFPDNDKVVKKEITVAVRGEYRATLYNTLTGTKEELASKVKTGLTEISAVMYNHDSLLIRLEKGKKPIFVAKKEGEGKKEYMPSKAKFTLSEPNVLLLDRAYYAVDTDRYSPIRREIMILDNKCRAKYGFRRHGGHICQPWAQVKKQAHHVIRLKLSIFSTIEYSEPELALEDATLAKIVLNGERIENKVSGWYVDKSIQKVKLTKLKKGRNILEVTLPFGENTNTEWCYLLGNFGVNVVGGFTYICDLPKEVSFGDLTQQKLPFYGGKITYHTSIETSGKETTISVPYFRSAVMEVSANGIAKDIAFAPYEVRLPVKKGKTDVDITAYISRQNAFGSIHNPNENVVGHVISPSDYRFGPNGLGSCWKYNLAKTGILKTPTFTK